MLVKALSFDLHEHTMKCVTSSKWHGNLSKFKRVKNVKRSMDVLALPMKQKMSVF